MGRMLLLLLLVVMTTPVTGDQSGSRSRRSSGNNGVINNGGEIDYPTHTYGVSYYHSRSEGAIVSSSVYKSLNLYFTINMVAK